MAGKMVYEETNAAIGLEARVYAPDSREYVTAYAYDLDAEDAIGHKRFPVAEVGKAILYARKVADL